MSSRFNVDCVIYRFLPHGSRKLEDLTQLNNINLPWQEWVQCPNVIIHDQEPLRPDLYKPTQLLTCMDKWYQKNIPAAQQIIHNDRLAEYLSQCNLAFVRQGFTTYDRNILIHSELHSQQMAFYDTHGFECVYWWSHAMIARDWYRYAEHDPELDFQTTPRKCFNIYNRAWSGSREYRLKFADLLIEHDLISHSHTSFSPQDQDRNWRDHVFINNNFKPRHDLDQLPVNTSESWYSADYSASDYQQSWWDVVLETIFDEQRIHLTEKILRPIACGKPFVAVAAPGALSVLRSYGFKTFAEVIDESYDVEHDSMSRMHKVIKVMTDIAASSPSQRARMSGEIKVIVEHNKRRFFSRDFQQFVLDELDKNFADAYVRCQQHRQGKNWSKVRALSRSHPYSKDFFTTYNAARTRGDIVKVCDSLRRARRESRGSNHQVDPAVRAP